MPAAHGLCYAKPHTVRDSLFAMVFKVYGTLSSCRFSCDLAEAHRRGHLSRDIPGLKVPQFMEDEAYTPILKQLITETSLPLRAVDTDFAVDSSGFGSRRFDSWFDEKYGTKRKQKVWVKRWRVPSNPRQTPRLDQTYRQYLTAIEW